MSSVRPSTPVSIPAAEANQQFSELVQRANTGEEHFVIEQDGQPVVALISMAEYETLLHSQATLEEQKRARRQFFEQFSRDMSKAIQESGLTEEEWMAELEKDKEAVYRETYGDKS